MRGCRYEKNRDGHPGADSMCPLRNNSAPDTFRVRLWRLGPLTSPIPYLPGKRGYQRRAPLPPLAPFVQRGLWKPYHHFLFTSFLYPHRDRKPCCFLSDRLFENHNLFWVPSIRHIDVFISSKFLRSPGKPGRGDSLSAVAISPV